MFGINEVQFEPRILWEHSENIELLKLFSAQNENFLNRFDSSDTTLSMLILSIENEMRNKNIGYKKQVKYLLLSALIHIMRNHPYTKKTLHLPVAKSQNNSKKMLYIDSNLENRLTLKDIADTACMTQTYFSSFFKKFNGISSWEYITLKCVKMAMNLLKASDMSRLEIAKRYGFSSSSSFYKAFLKIP